MSQLIEVRCKTTPSIWRRRPHGGCRQLLARVDSGSRCTLELKCPRCHSMQYHSIGVS